MFKGFKQLQRIPCFMIKHHPVESKFWSVDLIDRSNDFWLKWLQGSGRFFRAELDASVEYIDLQVSSFKILVNSRHISTAHQGYWRRLWIFGRWWHSVVILIRSNYLQLVLQQTRSTYSRPITVSFNATCGLTFNIISLACDQDFCTLWVRSQETGLCNRNMIRI